MFNERSYLRHVSAYLEDVAANKSKDTPPKWYADKRSEVVYGSEIITTAVEPQDWWRERWLAAYEASWRGFFDSSGPPYNNLGHPVSGKQISDYFLLSKAALLESRIVVKRKDAVNFLESEGLDSRMIGSRINKTVYQSVFDRNTTEYSGSVLYTYAEALALASVDKSLSELKSKSKSERIVLEANTPLRSVGLAAKENFEAAFTPFLVASSSPQ